MNPPLNYILFSKTKIHWQVYELDKEAKARLLGFTLIILGFLLMTLYPYSMYFKGDKVAEEVVKATLTLTVVFLSIAMVSLGVSLSRRE